MGFAKLFGASGNCLHSDGWGWGQLQGHLVSALVGRQGLCPKYLSNLFRAWKIDDTHSGNHSRPKAVPARACGCSRSTWQGSSAHRWGPASPRGCAGSFLKL